VDDGAYYYLTSSDISFVYLFVYLSVSISGIFFSIALGREGNVDTVFSFGLVCCYISAESFLKALYVSCHVQPVLVSEWVLPL